MGVEVLVRTAEVVNGLRDLERRTRFDLAGAINNTAKRIQTAERARLRAAFTVRGAADFLMRRAAVIKPFASAPERRFEARIAVNASGSRLLLPQFETGGTRKPMTVGARSVAVPFTGGPARPTFAGGVPPALRLRALRIVAKTTRGRKPKHGAKGSKRRRADIDFHAHLTSGGKVQLKGRLRTFILKETKRAPHGGVYQRVGPGRDDIRLVYPFVPSPRLSAVLEYIKTAQHTADRWYGYELRRGLEETARRSLLR